MTEMISRSFLLLLCFVSWGWSAGESDADMDGVPDTLDVCSNTPFLDEVNAQGCSVNRLILPDEKEHSSMDMIVGYGISHNEDRIGREIEHYSKLELNYYSNHWIYSISTGYFLSHNVSKIQDSIVSVKKRWRLSEKLKLTTGVALKLPSYDFQGNRTDYRLSTVLNYYPFEKWAFYTGIDYTFVQDKAYTTPLQDSSRLFMGSGYFFSKKFYSNLSYTYGKSKFQQEHEIHTFGTTLFYQINNQWFSTLAYHNEFLDEDLHNDFEIKLGYSFW